jgi:hypothetical protein
MIVSDFFKVEYGQRIYHSKSFLDDKFGKTPLISSGKSDHGFYGIFGIEPLYSNVISVANTGSVGWAFYHNYDCCIDDNCLVLIPKTRMSDQQMVYFAMLLSKDKYRYMYGRQVTPIRIENIKLPDIPNFVIKKEFPNINEVKKPVSNKKVFLSDRKWKWFHCGNLFDIEYGQREYTSKDILDLPNGSVPLISSTGENNGVYGFYSIQPKYSHVLSIARTGSVGATFYHDYDCCISDDCMVLHPIKENLDIFNGLFLSFILGQDKYRYSYARKVTPTRLRESKIKLPVDKNGDPDWQFMKDYIKSLPYSASL